MATVALVIQAKLLWYQGTDVISSPIGHFLFELKCEENSRNAVSMICINLIYALYITQFVINVVDSECLYTYCDCCGFILC